MTYSASRAASGQFLIRAALAAAIALPFAHPAAAAQMTARPLPPNARFAVGHRALGSDVIRRLTHSRKARAASKVAHFAYPYGLAADSRGNVYVTNFNANSVSLIAPSFHATKGVITQGLTSPISVAVDPLGYVFVGSVAGGNGYVTKFLAAQPVLSITANASVPSSIAVDEFDDLYIVGNGGIAADDPYGNSIFGLEYTGYNIISVAVGNGNVYGFLNDNYLVGNGSVLLRSGGLQAIVGPAGSVTPVGAACGDTLCWYSDSTNDTLTVSTGNGTNSTSLGYQPAGVAYDSLHKRVFVADPVNNTVHVYNPQTLALEKTIT
ncbi:MAG: hypothetical protein JO043_04490 [Candidatus Eremiobacteraeota bacterium]|nr:hypothetical protein [Candidatus Eremiobacteraeota bacterium]